MERQKIPALSAKKIIASILASVPEGWTVETLPDTFVRGRETWDREKAEGTTSIVLQTEGVMFICRISEYKRKGSLDGSTWFKGRDFWRTFDRVGVDSSFSWYSEYAFEPFDMPKIIQEQLKDIAEAREREMTAIAIPGAPLHGWTIQPKGLEEYKQMLQAGRSVTFMPSGFGTGYRVFTRGQVSRYGGGRCSQETARFFGVPVLYFERMDCD